MTVRANDIPVIRRLPHLDMLRGVAAVMVCAGHLRAFLFVDYGESGGGVASRLFYALTSRHHQAVMIFFVLSGFLVGGSVLRAHRRGNWSWRHYLVQRLGRLWIVIVPALLLTCFWDTLGARLSPAAYDGSLWGQLSSGPPAGQGADLSLATIIGNLLFLQTITVPTLGSNGPLWSLANEFWYYVLFPLAVVAWRGGPWRARAGAAVLALLILAFLPPVIRAYGLLWLAGVAAFVAAEAARAAPRLVRVVGILAGISLLLLIAASAKWPSQTSDFAIGFACACMLPWLSQAPGLGRLYGTLGRGLSEVSYTLYLVHFPWLMFLYVAFLAPTQYHLSIGSLGLYLAVLALTLGYAAVLWFVFERNTDRFRGAVEAVFARGKSRTEGVRRS